MAEDCSAVEGNGPGRRGPSSSPGWGAGSPPPTTLRATPRGADPIPLPTWLLAGAAIAAGAQATGLSLLDRAEGAQAAGAFVLRRCVGGAGSHHADDGLAGRLCRVTRS